MLYLKWFSRELELQGREHLDPEWSLVPIGGLDSIAPFATLFATPSQRIVVLTDGLMSHPRRLEGLWERGILQFGRILRPALYLDVDQEDAQIEDLLGRRLYRELVTGCYNLKESGVLADDDDSGGRRADAPRGASRCALHHVAALGAAVRQLRSGVVPVREHGPELRETLPELDIALLRFEKLFRDLNSFVVD